MAWGSESLGPNGETLPPIMRAPIEWELQQTQRHVQRIRSEDATLADVFRRLLMSGISWSIGENLHIAGQVLPVTLSEQSALTAFIADQRSHP